MSASECPRIKTLRMDFKELKKTLFFSISEDVALNDFEKY